MRQLVGAPSPTLGRSGASSANGDPATQSAVPQSPGQPKLPPPSSDPDPDVIEPDTTPNSVPKPPDSNGKGGDSGDTPVLTIPAKNPTEYPTFYSSIGWVAPGILTNMANSIWQDLANALLDPTTRFQVSY